MRRGLILGRADTVWDEAKAAKKLCDYDEIIVVNVIGQDYREPFGHWVTFHPELLPLWERQRLAPLPKRLMYWSGINRGMKLGAMMQRQFPLQYVDFTGGSSGMLAVKVAIIGLGLDRVVLAGVPMTDTARYDDRRPWTEAKQYQQTWRDEQKWMAGRVRSMSGWTAELLGIPDAEWLGVDHARESAVA